MITPLRKLLGYSQIVDQSHECGTETHEKTGRSETSLSIRYLLSCSVVLAVIAASLGFYAGRGIRMDAQHQVTPASYTSNQYISKKFTSNVTFGKAPSPETDRAWESLYPGMRPHSLLDSR